VEHPASQGQRDNTEIIEEQNIFVNHHLTIKLNLTGHIIGPTELNA
jgi:hypothetical protein